MLQLERIKQAEELLDEVYDEMCQGYTDEGLVQEAVNTQITVSRMVFHLNRIYYNADPKVWEDI